MRNTIAFIPPSPQVYDEQDIFDFSIFSEFCHVMFTFATVNDVSTVLLLTNRIYLIFFIFSELCYVVFMFATVNDVSGVLLYVVIVV